MCLIFIDEDLHGNYLTRKTTAFVHIGTWHVAISIHITLEVSTMHASTIPQLACNL